MMPIESTYNKFFAHYYDEFYKKNDYPLQIKNLISLFQKYDIIHNNKIIDIGCGTGEHAIHLAQGGYTVHGIDPSPYMIEKALEKKQTRNNVSFSCGYANTVSLTYDAAYSLFNVVNCLKDIAGLTSFFIDVSNLLKEKSCFVFEAWNTEKVLAEPPVAKQDILHCGNKIIERYVIPTLNEEKTTVKLAYNYTIDSSIETVTHFIRLFTESELHTAFTSAGFKHQEVSPSLNTYHLTKSPSQEHRNTTYVVTKN